MFNFYGFFIALGILIGVLVVQKIKEQTEKIKDFGWLRSIDIYQVLGWTLIPAIIGARLYHVIDYWEYYSKNLLEILFIWQGGLGIFGAIFGAILGLFLIKRIKKLSQKQFLSLLDLGVIGLSIGQAIGRWGNYFNQELYGWPTNLPWAIYIKPENRLAGFEDFTHFHPLFLYESIGCLIIFLILLVDWSFLLKKENFKQSPRKAGLRFFTYLFLYSFLRFFLEFLRPEKWMIANLSVAQVISLGLITTSLMYFNKKKS